MTMDKRSNEHITCSLCDEDAVPGTNPPLCAAHVKEQLDKKASAAAPGEKPPETLKELEDAK